MEICIHMRSRVTEVVNLMNLASSVSTGTDSSHALGQLRFLTTTCGVHLLVGRQRPILNKR